MKKILIPLLVLGSISAFAADYTVECYAKVKCPEGSHCDLQELVIDVVENEATSVVAKSRRRSSGVENFRTTEQSIVKISGNDAIGDSFSAKVDLNKVSETKEYTVAGNYKILRVFPVKLACRKTE